MSNYSFVFDLDATVTKQEILPELAHRVGRFLEVRTLTEKTMRGEIPFKTSFLQRVDILKTIPIHTVQEIVAEIDLNEQIAAFIREHRQRCHIVTGNLDLWIERLIARLGMTGRCLCSEGMAQGDCLLGVSHVIHKKEAIKAVAGPCVVIGDGDNDAEMIAAADIGIGFGGVRQIAPSVMQNANYAIYSEDKLCQFLKRLL